MQSLYLSYDGMTDQLGQSQVIPYLIKLSNEGYRFTIISFEKKIQFDKHRIETAQLLTANNIEWIPLIYHKSPPVLSTLLDLVNLLNTAKKICRQKKIEVVHCRSYITALVGLSLKGKFSVKFIFDMRGFWADERIEGKIWNLNNPLYAVIYHFFKRKEKQLLLAADHIITLTESAREIIKSWNYKSLPPVTVIPCCVDTHHFDPAKIDQEAARKKRAQLSLTDDQLVLGYIGAIGTWYMLDEMLDFFKILLSSKPSARFLFVTNEPVSSIINAAIKKTIPLESIIVTHASRNEMPLLISLMNISIFFIRPTFSKKGSSPTKMAELLSMGVPVISNKGIGDDDRIIKTTHSGLLLDEMNAASYITAISNLDALLMINKDLIRLAAVNYFSLEMGAKNYADVYESLTNNFS